MKILFLSDLHHLNDYPQKESGYERVFNDFPNVLESLTAIIKENSFDLLLLGGDLTEHGDVHDYLAIKERLEGYPYLMTLGNHDNKEAFYEAFEFQRQSGKYHHVHLHKNLCFILFDSSQEGLSEGHISENDLKWLDKQIKKHQDKDLILLTHHHLLKTQHDTPPLDGAEKILERIEEAGIKMVLSGHTHTPFYTMLAKTHFITSGSLAYRAHMEGQKLVFNNERYYSIIEINDHLDVEFKQVKEEIKVFTRFDLENETL